MTDSTLLAGKRGSGKSLIAVGMAKQYLEAGRMVATNLNLIMDRLMPPYSKATAYRLPDHPRASDLVALPLGNPGLQLLPGDPYPTYVKGREFKEEENGLLLLDEIATFLNSRSWNAEDRAAIISWLLQSRKYGWDLLFIAQHKN